MMDVGNRLSMVSVNGSVGNMGGSAHVFHGFELLVLRKLNTDAALFEKWKEKLRTKAANDDYDLGVSATENIVLKASDISKTCYVNHPNTTQPKV